MAVGIKQKELVNKVIQKVLFSHLIVSISKIFVFYFD